MAAKSSGKLGWGHQSGPRCPFSPLFLQRGFRLGRPSEVPGAHKEEMLGVGKKRKVASTSGTRLIRSFLVKRSLGAGSWPVR